MTNRTRISLLALALLAVPFTALGAPATVKAFEAEVHAAPDPDSPVIHIFSEHASVSVSEDVVNGFREVRLPDGTVGYVEERAVSLLPRRPPPRPPVPPAPAYAPPPPPAYVPPPPPGAPPPYYGARYFDPTAFRHLGFFLRFDLGLGYMHSSTTSATTLNFDSAHGVAGEVGVAIGGSLRENLMLSGHLWGTAAASPTLELGHASVPSGGDFSTTLFGIGPSIDYYFMPENVYVSVTPSLTWVRFSDFSGDFDTAPGFGTRMALGKEWWVTSHAGMGLAGWFAFSFNQESSGSGPTWRTLAGGLAFSATFQ